MNILFICTGNTCRSPMAEAMLKDQLPRIQVKSAGLFATDGNLANDKALKVLAERQIDFEHRAQQVDEHLLQWADLVLTMTMQHKQSLSLQYPEHQNKLFSLKEYADHKGGNRWRQLQEAYAKFEARRDAFIKAQEDELDQEALEKKLIDYLQADIEEIEELQYELHLLDISDPFGGDLTVYRQTANEIEQAISILKNKIEKQMEEEI